MSYAKNPLPGIEHILYEFMFVGNQTHIGTSGVSSFDLGEFRKAPEGFRKLTGNLVFLFCCNSGRLRKVSGSLPEACLECHLVSLRESWFFERPAYV